MAQTKNILIVAGEASGDLHAANLVKEIKKLYPDSAFFGLGGENLQGQGVDLYFNMVELAVVGLFEVLKNIGKFRDIFSGILKETERRNPDLAILVDYPGFNLRLAKELKKRKIPVIYYISPQIWAWGKDRIKQIRENIDLMLVILEFEEALYRKNGVNARFVGHPLLDSIKISTNNKEEILKRYGLNGKIKTIALLPGSRQKEITTLLPIMLKSAELISRATKDDVQFLILKTPTVKEEVFSKIIGDSCLQVKIVGDGFYDGLSVSDFAFVASGTATLETAIIGIPMIILYKVSFLTWLYIRSVIKIPYVGLVNVVAQNKIVEEFLQYRADPKRIAEYTIDLLRDKEKIASIKNELAKLRIKLGDKGASQTAAQAIVEFFSGNSH